MRKSVIEEFFRGYFDTVKSAKDYQDILSRSLELSGELEKCLSAEQKEIFRKVQYLSAKMENKVKFRFFKEAFKFGVLLGIECSE